MLVLSRKINETIVIGENVRVTVASVRGNQIRLAIEAPKHIPIHREELVRNRPAASAAILNTGL